MDIYSIGHAVVSFDKVQSMKNIPCSIYHLFGILGVGFSFRILVLENSVYLDQTIFEIKIENCV